MSWLTRKNKRNGNIELTSKPNVAKIHYMIEERDDLLGMSHKTLRYGHDFVKQHIYHLTGSNNYAFIGQLLTPVKVFFMDRIQHYPAGSDFLGYTRNGQTHITLSLEPLTSRYISYFIEELEQEEKKTQKGRSLRRGRQSKKRRV